MKLSIPKKSQSPQVTETSGVTTLPNRQARIWVSQSFRQSVLYQSGEVVAGMEITVPDNPQAVEAGFQKIRRVVETEIAPRLMEQRELLIELGEQNRR